MVHTWHGGCPLCLKKTVCCGIIYGFLALQTQSGSAESETGGALELRCCVLSRGCSVTSFIGRHESLSS